MTSAAIGIDVGTSGVRAASSASLGTGSARLLPSERGDPAGWWHAAESVLAALKESADLSGVCCIAVDGPLGTIVFLR